MIIKINDLIEVKHFCVEGTADAKEYWKPARVIFVNTYPDSHDTETGIRSIDVEYFDGTRDKLKWDTNTIRAVVAPLLFTDLDHRLSVVKRWGIAHTIQTQSVAEHVFNVERIALRIARLWFGIHDHRQLLDIMTMAHHHEDFEALSGDLPTMIKPYFNEGAFEREHKDLVPTFVPSEEWASSCRQIVKLADMLEGFHFLAMERALGNAYLSEHFEYEGPRIMKYVRETWPDNYLIVSLAQKALIDIVAGCKSSRHSRRGR